MKTFRNIYKNYIKLAAITAISIILYSVAAFGAAESAEEIGPGIVKAEPPASYESQQEESLGIFRTTGYCNCRKCSKGTGLTYSGNVPKVNHTISADISVLPLGTKVRIHDITYTVEDIGGGVNGNKVDIYYSSHEEALEHGLSEEEVFLVEWPAAETPDETPEALQEETSGPHGP